MSTSAEEIKRAKAYNLLKQSKIFPYFIRSSWWIISSAICRECEDIEINIVEELHALACKITETDDCLTEDEKMKLSEAYEKLMKMDVYYTDESHLDAKIKIWKLVATFSGEEADDVIDQNKRLEEVLTVIDRYRCFRV